MTAVLLALAIIVILVAIIVAGQPDEFSVSRQTRMSVPPEKIFPLVNELKRFETWNPWTEVDPNCKMTFEGPPAGVGASYLWSGNKVGAGRNTIVESVPYELVRMRLDFEKPMKATSTAEFSFRSESGQTVVTWSMFGPTNGCGKLFGMFMNSEAMCGSQFEKGLAKMKSIAESPSVKQTVAA